MTCIKRDGEVGTELLKTIGNAMKRKIEDQDIELRRQMIMISSLKDMLEAERQTCRFVSTIAVIEFIIIIIAFVCMWAGGPVA